MIKDMLKEYNKHTNLYDTLYLNLKKIKKYFDNNDMETYEKREIMYNLLKKTNDKRFCNGKYGNMYDSDIMGDNENYGNIATLLSYIFENDLEIKNGSVVISNFRNFINKYVDFFYINDYDESNVQYAMVSDELSLICENDFYYGNVITCEVCGKLIWQDDAHYIDCENKYVCSICIAADAIQYHSNDYFDELDENSNGKITYGFELETIPKYEIDRLEYKEHEKISDNEFIAHCDHDGSLCGYYDKNEKRCDDGVEFVSNIFTYDYLKNNLSKIYDLLDTLRDVGYTSHDNGLCGLHFHMAMNGKSLDKEICNKIMLFIHNNWNWFTKFTRRNNFRYCNDNLKYANDDDDFKNAKSTKAKLNKMYNKSYNNGHYGAFIDNDYRTNTSEFRMFRGTLIKETFMASFFFLNAMVLTAKNNKKLTFANIEKKLKQLGDYDIVKNYCLTRKITINGKVVDNIENNDMEMEA